MKRCLEKEEAKPLMILERGIWAPIKTFPKFIDAVFSSIFSTPCNIFLLNYKLPFPICTRCYPWSSSAVFSHIFGDRQQVLSKLFKNGRDIRVQSATWCLAAQVTDCLLQPDEIFLSLCEQNAATLQTHKLLQMELGEKFYSCSKKLT